MDYGNIGRSFSILHRRSQLFVTAACERLCLSYLEYVALLRILSSEGLSQEDLAAALCLDKAVVTRTIALLEEKNLAYREKDVRDRRMKRIYPTEQAKAEQGFLEEILASWMNYLRQDMDPQMTETAARGILLAAERASKANIPELVRQISSELGHA